MCASAHWWTPPLITYSHIKCTWLSRHWNAKQEKYFCNLLHICRYKLAQKFWPNLTHLSKVYSHQLSRSQAHASALHSIHQNTLTIYLTMCIVTFPLISAPRVFQFNNALQLLISCCKDVHFLAVQHSVWKSGISLKVLISIIALSANWYDIIFIKTSSDEFPHIICAY